MSELPNVKQLARSKQRHSFNKDKQHSRRGRGRGSERGGAGGGERGGRGGEPGRGRGRGGVGPSVEEDSDEESDEDILSYEHEDTSKFRRRPVVAQDRQFELNKEPVDDDEIPKLDIDSLLKQPIKEVEDAHFRFADESEWEFTGVPNAMIVIDCAKIAQKMKMLNISQRLDLDLSPFGEPPLLEADPLNIHTTLKYITIHQEPSSFSSSPSSSSIPSQQKNATPEDSFFDDILNSTPPPPPSSSLSLPSPPPPTSLSLPSPPPSSSLPLSSPPPFSTITPSSLRTTTISGEVKREEEEEKREEVMKESVGDLEDWLDSVI